MIVIALEQRPSKLIPAAYKSSSRITLIDTVSLPFASTSTARSNAFGLSGGEGLKALGERVEEGIGKERERVLVVLDSVNALAQQGTHAVVSLVRRILRQLDNGTGE